MLSPVTTGGGVRSQVLPTSPVPDGSPAPPHRIPVLLIGAGHDTPTSRSTLDSLACQTVEIDVVRGAVSLRRLTSEYVVLVLSGVVLDATACERAVWLLATHGDLACVTGAFAGQQVAPGLVNAAQFLVARRALAAEVLTDDVCQQSVAAAALAIGMRRNTGRSAGWLAEPVIRTCAPAEGLASVQTSGQAALRTIGLDEGLLVADGLSLSAIPVQQLRRVTRPALTVRPPACAGMRILALFQGFPMGGYTAFNAELLPHLAALGHAVTTCTTEWWRSDWRLDRVRASSPDIHHAHAIVPPSAVPAYIDWLITSRNIKVVLLSHTFLGLHTLPYLRARHPSVAFVDYVHTDWFETGMYGSYAAMATHWEGQLDAQLATSDALVQQLTDGGCEPAALRAAHIGIDTVAWQHSGPRHAAVRGSIGASADTLVLLFSGRLSAEKRPHLAVDVAARLRDEGHDVMLIFAGNGPLFDATRAHAERAALGERCKLLGEIDESTLKYVYAAADVFIAPSEIEGIARSLYEAMSMGCVPVVSDVGGQRELVVPGTGSLVPADRDDATRYVDGVRPFFDRAVRARASAASRAHIVAHFDSRVTVTKVCETLALARTRRRSRQAVVPPAMAEELAVMSIEIMRRHVLRSVGR